MKINMTHHTEKTRSELVEKYMEEIETDIRMAMIAAKSNPQAPKAEHYHEVLEKIRMAFSQIIADTERVERMRHTVTPEHIQLLLDVIGTYTHATTEEQCYWAGQLKALTPPPQEALSDRK